MVAICVGRQKRSIVAPAGFDASARPGTTCDALGYRILSVFIGRYPSLFAWSGNDRVVKYRPGSSGHDPMDEKRGAQTDRQAGAALDQETVERLRRGVVWMQKNRGLRLKDIAVGCDVAEHTVRNFAYGKAARPDNTFLGRLFRYLATYRDMVPSEIAWRAEGLAGTAAPRRNIAPLHYDIVRSEVQIDENDLLRVYERYAGYYLCFSRSQRANHLVVSWLHVRALNPTVRATRGELLMPRYTLYSRYPDRFDEGRYDDYIEAGYVVARHGNIFFTGQLDGELRCMILKEPSARKFAYLEGLRLTTSVDDRTPFAARAMCERLGLRVSRDTWKSRIGLFTPDDLRRNFDNADVVERALRAGGPLLYKDPE